MSGGDAQMNRIKCNFKKILDQGSVMSQIMATTPIKNSYSRF